MALNTSPNTLRFAAPVYPGDLMFLLCGSVTVGAVFQTCDDTPNDWTWRVWVNGGPDASDGRAKSELAAKSAALAAFRAFLHAAGLTIATSEEAR